MSRTETEEESAGRRALPLVGGRILSSDCPSRTLIRDVTGKWGILVLVALSEGPRRWGELRHGIAVISEKMLAQTLRVLEADGLVHRDSRPVVPPHVEYGLTAPGEEVTALLIPLLEWAGEYSEQRDG